MNVQIMVNGKELEMYEDDRINFTFQVNDIADVKDRQTNYTNSFNIPRTPTNVRIFEGLGLPSDSSTAPYKRLDCSVKIDGFDFINNGWLHIKETAEDYRCHIYSGIIGFFKSLENKTLADLDLSEIHHVKTSINVLNSYNNPNYRYLIADYNGDTYAIANGKKCLNIDTLVPSVAVKYLWGKIFTLIDFEFEIDPSFFDNLWFSYPKPIFAGSDNNKSVTFTANLVSFAWDKKANGTNHNPEYAFVVFHDNSVVNQNIMGYIHYQSVNYNGGAYDGLLGHLVAEESAQYKIEYELKDCGIPDYLNPAFFISKTMGNQPSNPRTALANMFHSKVFTNAGSGKIECVGEVVVQLQMNEKLTFGIQRNRNATVNYRDNKFQIKITKLGGSSTDFAKEFGQITINDFVKEILVKFGLTIFVENKKVKFKTLSERLNGGKIDWSEKYIQRLSESYIHNDYTQNNLFKYQYSDKEMDEYDGVIKINNQNIPYSKALFESKTYAPDGTVSIYLSENEREIVPILHFHDKEVTGDINNPEIKYRELNKRFHFLHARTVNKEVYMTSKKLDNGNHIFISHIANLADFNFLSWNYIINRYYDEMSRIIDKSRVHTIELDLSYMDVLSLDFEKVYYFEQEHQFYLLNKLSYDSNGSSKGEFIRVLPSNSNASNSGGNGNGAGNTQQVRIFWNDNNGTEPRSGTDNSLVIGYSITPPINGNAEFGWHISFNGSGSVGSHSLANPTSIPIQHGNYEVTLYINTDTDSYSSNTLTYSNTSCKKFFFRKTDFIADVSYMDCSDEEQLFNATPQPIGNVFYVCAKSILDSSGVVDITDYNNQQSC